MLRFGPTGAAALAALVGLVLGGCGNSANDDGAGPAPTGPTTTVDLSSRVEQFPVTDRSHVAGSVEYPQTPPVGGNHSPGLVRCGFYASPVITEGAVHSMEHGAVWITFRPNLPRTQVDRLRALARREYVLVSPWLDNTLPAPVVASAWGLQLKAQSADDPAVAAFVEMYANGPQTPEKGASC